jgi:hypothetical protein
VLNTVNAAITTIAPPVCAAPDIDVQLAFKMKRRLSRISVHKKCIRVDVVTGWRRRILVNPFKAQSASRRKTPSSQSATITIIPAAIMTAIQRPLRVVNFLMAFFLPLPSE